MELYKRADRILRADAMLSSLRGTGMKTKNIGEWDKWKDINGGRLQVKIRLYEVKKDTICAYMVVDSLGMVAAPLQADKNEVLSWLKEHGYKRDKQWYMEDYGMSEETWNEWNGIGNDGEE